MTTVSPKVDGHVDATATEPDDELHDQRDKNARDVPSAKIATFSATEEWIGGYFVVSHAGCGNPDLPLTRGDVFGFVNNRAAWQKRNYVYADGNVWVDDFKTSSDFYSSGTTNGLDGAESVAIAYISTHAATSGTTYRFVAGGDTAHGGCRVYTTQMSFGENNLRYLFLSTCESVQTDPRPVWGSDVHGIRALFGYDGDIVDSDKYGQYFFENWKKADAKTTDSFLDASWRVAHAHTPVATWLGPDQATAERRRDTETHFQLGSAASGWMATRWYNPVTFDRHLDLQQIVPMTVHFAPVPAEPSALFETFGLAVPRERVARTTTVDGNDCYTSEGTNLIYSTASGAMDLRAPANESRTPVEFDDAEAVRLALDYLSRHRGLVAQTQGVPDGVAMGLSATAVRHTVEGAGDQGGNYAQRRIQTTVILRPTLDGVPSIGTGGVVEVTLSGDREVARVRSVLRRIDAVERGLVTTEVAGLRDEAERRALEEVRARPRVESAELVTSEFGYFAADEAVVQTAARPAVRVVVRMEGGSFARLVETVFSLDELGGRSAGR